MDSSFSPALLRRLAAYSASAGVALAVAPSADAQIVYHDYDPDIVITEWNSTTNLDFDQDGNVDFVLKNLLSYTGGFQDIKLVRPQSADSRNGAFGYYLNFPYPAGIVSRLASGDIIGPDVTYPQNFFSSALVVGKRDGSPGEGFYNLLRDLGLITSSKTDKALHLWAEHVAKAHQWYIGHPTETA